MPRAHLARVVNRGVPGLPDWPLIEFFVRRAVKPFGEADPFLVNSFRSYKVLN